MSSTAHRPVLGREILRRLVSSLVALPARTVRGAAQWLEVRQQLRQLSELDRHLLRDIGLTETDRQSATVISVRKHIHATKEQ